MILTVGLTALASVALFVLQHYVGKRGRNRIARGQRAQGVVVSRRTTRAHGGTTHVQMAVDYRDAQGHVHRVTIIGSSLSSPQVDTRVPVVYDPHNPANARIETGMQSRNLVCGWLGALFGVIAVGWTLLFIFGGDEVRENFYYELVDTETPPGNPSAYRPFKHVPEIARFAGRHAKLVSITTTGVPPDGKLDLGQKVDDELSSVELVFVAKPNKHDRHVMHIKTDKALVTIKVAKPHKTYSTTGGGTKGRGETEHLHKGMARSPSPLFASVARDTKIAKVPKCTAAQLWRVAIAHGAAKVAARITYDAKGYVFYAYKNARRLELRFGQDCKLIEPKRR